MEQLKACYEAYFAKAKKVWEERPAWDGVLGFGQSTKDHPCHMEFYEAVTAWMEQFLKAPSADVAEAAITYILQTPESHKEEFTYWTLFAVHGVARPLVGLISPAHAGKMREWYDATYRRQERMPVHRELYKMLKKRERE